MTPTTILCYSLMFKILFIAPIYQKRWSIETVSCFDTYTDRLRSLATSLWCHVTNFCNYAIYDKAFSNEYDAQHGKEQCKRTVVLPIVRTIIKATLESNLTIRASLVSLTTTNKISMQRLYKAWNVFKKTCPSRLPYQTLAETDDVL